MTQVDFHFNVPDTGRYGCRLVRKAWQALSGLAREDAMSEYIAEAGRLKYRQLLGAV